MHPCRLLEEQRINPAAGADRLARWLLRNPWRLPGWQVFLLGVVQRERKGPLAWLVSWLLHFCSLAYGIGLQLNLLPYRLRPALAARLPARVHSIGNITVGGTGKTSAAAALARALTDRGERVALLSRGYSGSAAGVVSDGRRILMTAQQAGDEPFLLAHRLPGVAVLVGKDRRVTGRIAARLLGATALVLDDGFQYWKLRKDFEVVLVDALNPFGHGRLLPAGLLREPVSSLKRAHEIWLTHCDLAPQERVECLGRMLRRINPAARVIRTRHEPLSLTDMQGHILPLDSLKGRPIVALSSIGNPEAFERTLVRLGARPLPVRFRDHHRYSSQDVELVGRIASRLGCAVVTTEKDAVRLPSSGCRAPCWVVRVAIAPVAGEDSNWPVPGQ